MVRLNILRKPYVATTPRDYALLDFYFEANILHNSASTLGKTSVPQLSLPALYRVLSHQSDGKRKDDSFEERYLQLIVRGCLPAFGSGNHFEHFQANYLWVRLFALCVEKYKMTLSENGESTFSTSPSSTTMMKSVFLPDLFEGYHCVSPPRDPSLSVDTLISDLSSFDVPPIEVSTSPGRFLHLPNALLDRYILRNGDFFIPVESTTPAFDFIFKLRDYLTLVECKYSLPSSETTFDKNKIVEEKLTTLAAKYQHLDDKGNRFYKIGNNTVREETMILVFTVARPFPSSKKGLKSPYDHDSTKLSFLEDLRSLPVVQQFKGLIFVSDRAGLISTIGSPFNNCGSFLDEYEQKYKSEESSKQKEQRKEALDKFLDQVNPSDVVPLTPKSTTKRGGRSKAKKVI